MSEIAIADHRPWILILPGTAAGLRAQLEALAVRLDADLDERALAPDWRAELKDLRRAGPLRLIVRLRVRELWLAADALARLQHAAQAVPMALSPLANSDAVLSPAAPDRELDADPAAIDAGCAALGGHRVAAIDCAQPPLVIASGAADLDAPLGLVDHVYVHLPGLPINGLRTPADRRERAPAHPLASTRRALLRAGNQPLPAWTRAARDERPVVLHLLHGWGGGAQRFVRDLAAADPAREHLLLQALGHPGRARHGERLELSAASGGPVLRRYALTPSIGALAASHAGYAAALAEVIAEFAVEQLIVSSLIGHALDALRCGLPIVWIAHDYFPFWPALHRDFGDPVGRYDSAELKRDLAQGGGPFSERDPAGWEGLRSAALATFNAAAPQLVAPTQGVISNLQRVMPGLMPAGVHVIAHGLAAFATAEREIVAAPEAGGKLRLVVIGRLNGGKGIDLLRRALPRLSEHAELFLIGAGKAAEVLFGYSGVHVLLDYARERLPDILARLRPHAALMPATVSETYSYTLSELWSLGIPPIATRLGALAERIEDGQTGILLEPDVDALLAQIAQLDRDRAPLAAIREELLRRVPRSLAAMALDYAPLLPAGQRSPLRYAVQRADVRDLLQAVADDALGDAEWRLEAAQRRLAEQEAELARRADWGFELSQLVDERTRWARELESELTRARRWLSERETVYEQALAQAHAQRLAVDADLSRLHQEFAKNMEDAKAAHEALQKSLSARIDQMTRTLAERALQMDALNAHNQQLESAHVEQESQRAQLQAQRDQLMAERDALAGERDALIVVAQHRREMLASSSWRLTAPLRAAGLWIKRARASLKFRLARMLSLLRRARGSLASRGVWATLARIRQGWRDGRQQPPPLMEPVEPPVPEEVYELFDLPTSATPLVSIVVPVYNQLHYTFSCLKALAETAGSTPFEVIVVDDGSSDRTASEVPRIPGVRFHKNPQNLGFIGACNAGAALARGRFVFFLNNDTAVQAGWLEPLLRSYDEFDRVGLVGSKLIYPDGRLQEAGGIVFSDGSGWNYGRFDHPDDPRYDYPREADYCSGAAILIEKALFDRFGGFDALYKPAYYEDTDLAFKVRAAGLRVIYQPASRVVHFEGITGGTDTSSGTKRYQVINQSKFLERWQHALAFQPGPTDHAGIWRAATHRVKGRMLLIDATTPTPDQDSGSVRYINLVKVLRSLGWQCTFFADNRAYVPRYTDALRALGVEVQFHPWLNDPVAFFRERGQQFDAIMLSRHYVACHYVDLAREHAPQARLLFDTVDLHYLREQRAAKVEGSEALARQAEETRSAELDLVQRCDVTLVVSPVEMELLAREAPGRRVEVLSNVHEVAGRRADFAARKDIWFVGGFQHQPNVDAVLWFAREIWPQVRSELGDVHFHVVGSKMPEEIAALAGNGIEIHGFVADIHPYLDGCRMSVAPLRYGAGVKGKVNQSMAYGQPVVATPIAVEGMEISNGVDALVAENPAEFAAAVIRLYRDPALWLALSDAGLANIQSHFSFDAARRALERVLG